MDESDKSSESSGWTTRRKVLAVIVGILIVGAVIGEEEDEEVEADTDEPEEDEPEEGELEEDEDEGTDGREWAANLNLVTQMEIIGYTEQDTGRDTQAFMDVVTQQPTNEPSSEEIGEIAGGYATYVAEDPNPPRQLFVEVYDAEGGDVTATFEVQREWAREYLAGTITPDEYAMRVVETLSSV